MKMFRLALAAALPAFVLLVCIQLSARAAWTPPPDMQCWFTGGDTVNDRIWQLDNIKPMDKASEAILALKPVTFRYKKDLDPDGIAQFGLVAEDVEKVNPALVARDEQGKPYTVRYEAVNAMLLNSF